MLDLFAEIIFDEFLYDGHARRTADHDDFVDALIREARALFGEGVLGVFHRPFERRAAFLDYRRNQVLDLGPVDRLG
jgi:hypothetical protein